MHISTNTKAHLAVGITNFFFAVSYSCVKFLNDKNLISAFSLVITRIGVASLLFWFLFLFSKNKWSFDKKDLPLFLICSLNGVVLNQTLFITGLTLSSTLHAALLILLTPILISFGAVLFLKEKATVSKITGVVMGLVGAAILVLSKNHDAKQGKYPMLGDLLIIVNAICYTIYFLKVKTLMNKYNPIHVVRWIFTIGFIILLPFTFSSFIKTTWVSFSPLDWFSLSVIVLGATFFSYLFNLYGIKILGSAITGNYIYTQPVYVFVIAVIFIGEKVTATKSLAACLIILGVYLSSKKSE